MKLSAAASLFLLSETVSAFSVQTSLSSAGVTQRTSSSPTALSGYLDSLGAIPPPEEEEEEDDSYEATKMKKEDVANYGVGNWEGFVDFNEFDGGDGQMGVAGDGSKELEKFDMSEMVKSKAMSAKNAWGKTTGYADELRSKGVDTARAQQLENWNNQQEIRRQRNQQRYMAEEFDKVSADEDWRSLKSFGIERNQDFDLDETFGAVEAGDIEGTIQLTARIGGPMSTYEFGVRNEYMGFADFRAAFVPGTGPEWTITPTEGSLTRKEDTNFILRFRPQRPGVCEGYLVIETEDFKKTWKLVGSTA